MRLIDADIFKRYIMNSFYDSEHLLKKKKLEMWRSKWQRQSVKI